MPASVNSNNQTQKTETIGSSSHMPAAIGIQDKEIEIDAAQIQSQSDSDSEKSDQTTKTEGQNLGLQISSKDSQDKSSPLVHTNITNENEKVSQPLEKSFSQSSTTYEKVNQNLKMSDESTDTRNNGFDNQAGVTQSQPKSNSTLKMVDHDQAQQESSKVNQDKSPFLVHSNETNENDFVRLPLENSSGQMPAEDKEDQPGITKSNKGIDTQNKEGNPSLNQPKSRNEAIEPIKDGNKRPSINATQTGPVFLHANATANQKEILSNSFRRLATKLEKEDQDSKLDIDETEAPEQRAVPTPKKKQIPTFVRINETSFVPQTLATKTFKSINSAENESHEQIQENSSSKDEDTPDQGNNTSNSTIQGLSQRMTIHNNNHGILIPGFTITNHNHKNGKLTDLENSTSTSKELVKVSNCLSL